MPASTHRATFTWPGSSANTVFVTGAFDNWSGNTHALEKQSDGGFIGHVQLPFGQTYSYKYVVDGEWKTREDEAKEWDAAGNMNNVYTAPAESTAAVESTLAGSEKETSAPESSPVAAAAIPAPAESAAATSGPSSVPDEKATEPETLLASSVPGPASGAAPVAERGVAGANGGENPSNPLAAFNLGAPIGGGAAVTSTTTSTSGTVPIASASTPITIQKTETTTTTTTTTEDGQSIAAQAAAIGGGALAALGAGALAVGGAVEKVTGIDVIHHPISVEAAKKAGIDIKSLEKVDAPTHTATGASPVPASAVDALEEKIQNVKIDADKGAAGVGAGVGVGPGKTEQHAVPLPAKPEPKTSLPPPGSIPPPPKEDEAPKPDLHAQADNAADHKSVPAPIIKTISPRDPAKDRTLPQTDNEKEANQPISSNPNVSAKDVKQQAEAPPAPPGKAGATAAPAPTPAVVPASLAANTPVAAPTPVDKPVAPAAPVQNPAAVAQAQNVPAANAEPPQTPTKTAAAAVAGTPGSIASTPATTPQKGAQTTDDKIRKRKSSFFAKLKDRFSSSPDKHK